MKGTIEQIKVVDGGVELLVFVPKPMGPFLQPGDEGYGEVWAEYQQRLDTFEKLHLGEVTLEQ